MNNNYDERYEIRLARKNDIPDIMSFIEKHWKSGHIMARDRDLFEYEFLEEDGSVNFVLAIDKEKGSIECLNGFLKASHDKEHLDIWGSIWKVLDENMGMLGVEIIRRREILTGCRCDLDVGNNPKTAIPILKVLLKRHTAKMNHYYRLAEINDYRIAKVERRPQKVAYRHQYKVIRINNLAELTNRFDCEKYIEITPYKDMWYINHRFFMHPIYDYLLYGIEDEQGEVNALMVLRNQEYDGRVAIRFVDYIGEARLLAGTGQFFEELLRVENVEYVDFYCLGLDEKYVEEAGFSLVAEGDNNIIPNYFSPFCQENIDIWVDSSYPDSRFFKADADQDRPN